jgi:hypothetical protein
LDAVTESDLQYLIDNGEAEIRTVEYKSILPGTSDAEKREFLSDVSSFANTIGGHIIYGMVASAGVPTQLQGIEIGDQDAVKLRLEDMIRQGIQPRISGIGIHIVSLKSSAKAVVIRIPRSWASPHMVTYQNYSRFFARNSAGKYQLDVTELRAAFLVSQNASETVRGFRTDRLIRIGSGETPVPLKEGAKIVLHMVPLGIAEGATALNVASLSAIELKPMYCSSWDSRLNFDGALGYSTHSYLQVFRNGAIEGVEGLLLRDGKIPCIAYEKELLSALKQYLLISKKIGVELPILLMLSLIRVRGFVMVTGQSLSWDDTYPIDREDLLAPVGIIESYDSDSATVLKPSFDSIWNACGYPQSLNYNNKGKWVGISSANRTA